MAVIGVVFCLLGAEALWSTAADLMASKVRPDLFVFCLPVGVGLLRGKPSSQWWAWLWIILGYVMNTASIVVLAFFLGPESITGEFVGGNHHVEVLAP